MPKILKYNDVIIENYFFIPDVIEIGDLPENEKTKGKNIKLPDANLSMPNESSSTKRQNVLWQTKLRAHKIIEQANEYADKLILNASEKAQEELAQAQKTGYTEGYADGKRKAQEDMKAKLDELTQMIGVFEQEKKALLDEQEDQLKDLVLHMAKKIVDTELKQNDALFLSIYDRAVKQYNESEWIKVSVSPFEAKFAVSNAKLLLEMVKGAKDIQIEVLEAAPRGTCIVETALSIVDASVETQFKKLQESLLRAEVSV